MVLPLGALTSLTGGGGLQQSTSSTSGDARAGDVGGGISSPVVIGGFKSDGSATASNVPMLALYIGGGILALGVLIWLFRSK